MKNKKYIFLGGLIIFIFVSIFLILPLTLKNAKLNEKSYLERISIVGLYSVDDGEKQELKNIKIDTRKNHLISVYGNFSTSIPENYLLMFRLTDLNFTLKINGEQIYNFTGDNVDIFKSRGDAWAKVISPGISETDDVEITISSCYSNVSQKQFTNFFDMIYIGADGALFDLMWNIHGWKLIVGICMLAISTIVLIVIIFMGMFKLVNVERPCFLALFSIFGSIWFLIDFNLISLITPYSLFFNVIQMISISLMPIFAYLYLMTYFDSKIMLVPLLGVCYSALFLVTEIIMQLLGVIDLREWSPFLSILLVLCAIIYIICNIHQLKAYKNKNARILLLTSSPIILGGVFELLYSIDVLKIGDFIFRICFLMFILIQMVFIIYYAVYNLKKANATNALENEITKNKISIMLSQIKPHFLYNSLTAIKQLCSINPALAEKATDDFAHYLRANIDTLSVDDLIPFEKELEHIKHYVNLEIMRFQNRVNVKYNIEESDFLVPPLSIQPIVENAIKYGITKKESGGTVTINVYRKENLYFIEVNDDGIGFDVEGTKDESRRHVGIENVKSRLLAQVKGQMIIDSEINKGTDVTIIIPAGE